MPDSTTVPEVKPAESIPTTWPGVAVKALHLYGAAGVLVVGLAWFSYSMVERSERRADQQILEQKESATANLKVVIESTHAITSTGQAIKEVGQAVGKVGDSVEANTKATEEIARDVRELREELRREK